ncbi:hypothetical protein [Clostridium guangxiense]|uniref:hypothetical protein n=1 Tax=Clostridium guangxiense TaxID=1662055 RepID=UPI001E367650|nr:hypothetical protein [Clostridium guangxiense]MCD2346099.1 hypothetical protein [Clostridium guangxiense]
MGEDEIDKKNDLALLKFDKAALVKKLKKIEARFDDICKENKYNYFEMDRYILKASTENIKFYISVRKNKFRLKIRAFNDEVYYLDELLDLEYDKDLLKALFELYSNIDTILGCNLEVY